MAASSVSSTCSKPSVSFRYAERCGSETRSSSRVTSGEITARYSDSSCSHQRMVRSRRNGSPLSRYAPITEVSKYVLGFIDCDVIANGLTHPEAVDRSSECLQVAAAQSASRHAESQK